MTGMRSVTTAMLMLFTIASASVAGALDCQAVMTCEKNRCLDVPGQFVQVFDLPKGGSGETMFRHGTAQVFASSKDVIPAIKVGSVSRGVRYVVWPDDTGRGGEPLDARIYAVKWLVWDEGKPSLSSTTTLMMCSDRNAE